MVRGNRWYRILQSTYAVSYEAVIYLTRLLPNCGEEKPVDVYQDNGKCAFKILISYKCTVSEKCFKKLPVVFLSLHITFLDPNFAASDYLLLSNLKRNTERHCSWWCRSSQQIRSLLYCFSPSFSNIIRKSKSSLFVECEIHLKSTRSRNEIGFLFICCKIVFNVNY